ncbi:uncharacterized protein LOC141628258 [Silene latifolia]|uniref:uncharacterized protein LOC141628258 n=1 Tax=Silene latifolia TaxID=37657 RepID=UPI003D76D1B6
MILATWNIRGFNKPIKHSEVNLFLKENNVDVLGLLETRVKSTKAKTILRSKFKRYKAFCNYNKHYNGRIWVLWNPSTTKVDILQEEAQVIHCKIRHYLTGKEFYLSVVYGSNSATRRHDLWDSLHQFSTSVTQWAAMGDFNVVRHSHEKISATPPILSELMDFNSCLLNCGLDDMSGTGNDFTWFNKQEVSTRVYSKLDRILVNNTWLQAYSQTTAHFLDPGISDHCLGLLTFHDNDRPRKHFKFLNCWTEHPQFLQ